MLLFIWHQLYYWIKVLLLALIVVIHLIGTHFVINGLLDKSYGRLFSRLFELRQSGDYDDLYEATETEVFPYIDKSFHFLKDMESLITLR